MHRTLDEVTPEDAAHIGGKAYNCARLRHAGFPVPDGLAIPSGASDPEIRSVVEAPWLAAQPGEALFAVRSSGLGEDSEGHSFAGIHDTYLNVRREELVDAVFRCRASGASKQAAAYRAQRQLDRTGNTGGSDATDWSPARIGVLVQQMVPAVASGVAFTVNPVSGADELVINAAPGLGEALVSGQVDPDEFIVGKRDGLVVSRRAGSAGLITTAPAISTPTLTAKQIADLAALLLRIEQHYGAPQDVEWCHDGRQFWIVQSRPVTAIHSGRSQAGPEVSSHSGVVVGANVGSHDGSHVIADLGANVAPHNGSQVGNPDTEWTRANLMEVLPEQVSPQALGVFEVMLNRAQRQFMGRLLASDAELGPVFKSFRGRMYMNLSQMRRVSRLIGAPPANMLRSVGHAEQIRAEDEVGTRAPLREILRCLPDFIRLAAMDLRAARLMRRHEANTRDAIAHLTAGDPRTSADHDLWATMRWWEDLGPDAMQMVFVMSGMLPRETLVRQACAKVGFPYERLVYPHLAAGERSVSTRQAIALVGLAEVARQDQATTRYLVDNDGAFRDLREKLAGSNFLERFDRFLDEYGHRGRYESDWALPRLHEQPAPALFAIQQHLHAPPTDLTLVSARQQAEAATAWQEFEARLTLWQRWTMRPRVRATLRQLKQRYVWREQVRSDLTRVMRYMRVLHVILADRFVERGWIALRDDYFLLRIEEIAPAIDDPGAGPSLRDIVARRQIEREAERQLRMPLLMRERDLEGLLRAVPAPGAHDASVLTGLCVSPGRVEAEVVVMRDPAEFASMKRGAILVAPATDPSWTPLFTLASGVIVEVGGMLSHASTIAREYGLPALANVKDATRVLQTGDRVELDASGAFVRRLSRAS